MLMVGLSVLMTVPGSGSICTILPVCIEAFLLVVLVSFGMGMIAVLMAMIPFFVAAGSFGMLMAVIPAL